MSLDRKHGWIIAAIAAWNVFIWITFAKNLSAAHSAGEDRPLHWVAHTVLIIVGLVTAAVLFWLARKILRRA